MAWAQSRHWTYELSTDRKNAYAMLLITMVIWGSTFVVTKEIIAQFPPLLLAFIRVAIGALVLLPFAVRRHRAAAAPRLPWSVLALMAFIGVAFYYVAFNLSMLYTTASQGALVQSCIPAMTALIAMLWLRERASKQRIFGIALSMVGVAIVFLGDAKQDAGSNALLGNTLMFLTVVCWGIYTALAKRVADRDPLVVTAGITGLGAWMLLPFAIYESVGTTAPSVEVGAWLRIIYLGAIASGVAYVFYSRALRHMEASQAGVFTNLIPIVGVIAGLVALNEALSVWAILGGLVVLVGVWLTSREEVS
jgi:drug/metabolite transporter (DMT)-like permease